MGEIVNLRMARKRKAREEASRAAEDEDDENVRRALEVEHAERHRLGGLRQQRASDPGNRCGDRVDLLQVPAALGADGTHARDVFANAAQRQAERRVDQPAADKKEQEQDD